MADDPRCRKCRTPLLYEDELDFGMCEDCLETAADRSRERDAWGAFHDEPCPEVELTQYPAPPASDDETEA